MRNLHTSVVAAAVMVFSTPVIAQSGAESVDYNCALFDECGGAAAPTSEKQKAGRVSGGTRGGFTMRRATPEASKPQTKAPAATVGRAPSSSKQQLATPKAQPTPGRSQAANSAALNAAQQITFVSGSAELQPSAKLVAQKLAAAMQRPDKLGLRFRIEGHTDAVGSRELNMDLSARRAQAVANYLGSLGVDTKRLDIAGYGFDRPIPGISKLAGANRRVVTAVVK